MIVAAWHPPLSRRAAGALEEAFVAPRPVRYVPTYRDTFRARLATATGAGALAERLRELGYRR